MKRISILILVVLLAVGTAQSQFRFGVKGGVNVSKARFEDEASLKSEALSGYYLGPTLEGMIGQGGIGFDLSLLFSKKGFDSDEFNKVNNHYLEVPVNLKFKLGLPVINPYLAAGPYIDLCIGGNKKWKSSMSNIEEQIKTKSFGAGLNFAIGADLFSKLQVGLNYSMALTDNYSAFDGKNPDSYKGKLWVASLSAAYFF